MITIGFSTALTLVALVPATAFWLFFFLAAVSFVKNFDVSDATFFAIFATLAMAAPVFLGWGWVLGFVSFSGVAP